MVGGDFGLFCAMLGLQIDIDKSMLLGINMKGNNIRGWGILPLRFPFVS